MKISIIIRCFNEEKHIVNLFSCIEKQITNFEYEVVVVDSGSTDKTVELVKQYNCKLIQIFPDEFTFGYSLNKGISAADGEFCVILSAHCYPLRNDWLASMVSPFEDERVALVYGRQVGGKTSKYSECKIFEKWFPEESMISSTLAFCNNANSAIRKKLWEQYKFNELLTGLEDIDWAKFVRERDLLIAYQAEAGVLHIHDETAKQVFNRYYREALAYREIYPREYFSCLDFIKFFIVNTYFDYISAIKDKVFLRNVVWIPLFRFLQFWGTYRGHQFKVPVNKEMQKKIFYPKKHDMEVGQYLNAATSYLEKRGIIDITRSLCGNMAVWPGSDSFQLTIKKDYGKDGVRESCLSMNLHSGTHVDAPIHFLQSGKDIEELSLEKMIGSALVVEYKGTENVIGVDFLKKNCGRAKRILIKTRNSQINWLNSTFDEKFIALSTQAAEWLAHSGIELVGVDGPSVQHFYDKDNRTHEVLLKNEVVILEGLDLSNVTPGWYQLICTPLKVRGAEGAPARAILLDEAFV